MLVTTTPATLPVKLQLALAAWLDEHSARPLTHGAYDAEMGRFRAALIGSSLIDGLVVAASPYLSRQLRIRYARWPNW